MVIDYRLGKVTPGRSAATSHFSVGGEASDQFVCEEIMRHLHFVAKGVYFSVVFGASIRGSMVSRCHPEGGELQIFPKISEPSLPAFLEDRETCWESKFVLGLFSQVGTSASRLGMTWTIMD